MTQRPSGWYDDPDDPDQLRYWDGILWSDRKMAKVKPGLEDSHLSESPRREHSQPYAARRQGNPYDPPQRGYRPPASRTYAPLQAPTTPDGQRLSGWWRRVFAYVIDYVLVYIVAGLITYPWLSTWLTAYQNWANAVLATAESGGQAPSVPDSVLHLPWQTLLADLLVYAVYEIAMVAYRGQTVGKMATRIRVRRAGTGGNPSLQESAIRFVVKQANLIGVLVAVLGTVTVIFTVVDYLAPLFNRLKLAIHDRAARTYVVRTAAPPKLPPGPRGW